MSHCSNYYRGLGVRYGGFGVLGYSYGCEYGSFSRLHYGCGFRDYGHDFDYGIHSYDNFHHPLCYGGYRFSDFY
uniref:Uncharacterized protein n=1 Tax=Catagonus wagneri TaxID=51154 RepID=A0A8C3X048_9CETA